MISESLLTAEKIADKAEVDPKTLGNIAKKGRCHPGTLKKTIPVLATALRIDENAIRARLLDLQLPLKNNEPLNESTKKNETAGKQIAGDDQELQQKLLLIGLFPKKNSGTIMNLTLLLPDGFYSASKSKAEALGLEVGNCIYGWSCSPEFKGDLFAEGEIALQLFNFAGKLVQARLRSVYAVYREEEWSNEEEIKGFVVEKFEKLAA